MGRLLREFGSDLVTDLRSESRGCSMSGRLCAPGTDRISAWDTDSLSDPNTD
jgi:hypothetical protein